MTESEAYGLLSRASRHVPPVKSDMPNRIWIKRYSYREAVEILRADPDWDRALMLAVLEVDTL